MAPPRPRGLKRDPRPCGVCGTPTTNYCNECKQRFYPDHLIYIKGAGWHCEECEVVVANRDDDDADEEGE